jgi:hypothetical protein
MKRNVGAIVAALAICMVPLAGLAQTPYTQDFEGLTPVNGSLAADGWWNYGNVFDEWWNWWYGYGAFAAVNNIGNWQDITTGQGGPEQGDQQLVVYSDYANAAHGDTTQLVRIESNCYQEQTIDVGASGVWEFTFDAKKGDLAGGSTAAAFIKTLTGAPDYATTNYIPLDMTGIPTTWGTYMVTIDVTGLDGQLIQFGFQSWASRYEPCGIIYDNVNFGPEGGTPVEETTWGAIKSMF